ncbi:hypothetical protein Cgig2_011092 [Carnegiea gigantea]|uniref:GH3 middle domain-containing protein n=1 Tax=Carnegiea gigantea TaxID=171969 RepID=A0A9Q1GQM7_9CARY|nr:hypothetical protein Cgig2_011092 [Carnegiea gigantea]
MRPDPELAGFIDHACSEGKWEGIIKKIWPNAKYLSVIVTGAMAQNIPTLDYYSGGLPKVSAMYASSECVCGLNLKPLCDPLDISYTIFPNMGYFEFIPLDEPTDFTRDSMTQLVDLVHVKVGKEYELVVTTHAGLYRYQVADVLRVTGWRRFTCDRLLQLNSRIEVCKKKESVAQHKHRQN